MGVENFRGGRVRYRERGRAELSQFLVSLDVNPEGLIDEQGVSGERRPDRVEILSEERINVGRLVLRDVRARGGCLELGLRVGQLLLDRCEFVLECLALTRLGHIISRTPACDQCQHQGDRDHRVSHLGFLSPSGCGCRGLDRQTLPSGSVGPSESVANGNWAVISNAPENSLAPHATNAVAN
jgi:hypothetical protein